MTHYWEPDADTLTHYQLPKSATGEHHSYAELAPPPDLPELEPIPKPQHPASYCAGRGYCEYHQQIPPLRGEQVIKALMRIASDVDLWEAGGKAAELDHYLAAFFPGPHGTLDAYDGNLADYEPGHNPYATYPLANLGRHTDEHKIPCDAARVLRHPHGGAS